MPNLELVRKKNLSSFRKIAIGTWQNAYDPSVYGTLTLRMDEAQRYLDRFRQTTGKRLTFSHMMAKAAAAVFEKMPDANAVLRWNRIYLRKRIGTFFQVAMEDPDTGEIDLSGAMIEDPEKKTLAVMSFLSYTLNLDLRWMGVPKDPFGSIMITNIGSLGLEQAYVPLVPYSRVPLLVAMGSVIEAPVVEDGKLVVGKIMRVCATFDHRVLDGSHAAVMSKTLRAWMEHPFEHFDPLPVAVAEVA
jgi:pyruvate dehydrogenase E2 component (dihydrolipoamide acetyltransferase)